MLICLRMSVEQVTNAEQVPVKDAATLLLLRDAPEQGVEIFMVRRNQRTAFGPGDYVFPGGALDDADTSPELYRRCRGLDDARASARLGVQENGLSAWIAAIRECFEEAGVLLAVDAQGNALRPDEALYSERIALHARKTILADVCAAYDLRLAVDKLHYYGHWITPLGPPRRYSTRFFAVAAPPDQTAAHDGVETVAGEWVSPDDALQRHKQGGFPMILPTLSQLRFFRRYSNAAAALAAVAAIRDVPTVAPYLARDSAGKLHPVLGSKSGAAHHGEK